MATIPLSPKKKPARNRSTEQPVRTLCSPSLFLADIPARKTTKALCTYVLFDGLEIVLELSHL